MFVLIKYSKHGRSSFSHTFNCDGFSLFWPKKLHFKVKISLFLNFMLINFLVTMCINYNCPWNMKKTPSKVGYFSNIAEIFSSYISNDPVARLKTFIAFSIIIKGQLISEWLFYFLNFPNKQRKNLTNLRPRTIWAI